MIVSHRRLAYAPALAIAALAASLAGCGAPARDDVAADARPLRVMVRLVRSSEDAAAIAAEATRVAGVPVTHAAAASATWHALALHCASTAECDAAITRLRAAGNLYQTVEIEGRKTRAAS
jgi:hypothetical protein